jgi:hypothetical protein
MKNKPQFALDNNLSLVYSYLRLKGGRLLAIRFSYKGKRFEVDTPEEAAKTLEHFEKEDRLAAEAGGVDEDQVLYEKTKWTDDRFQDLVNNIGAAQKLFLAALLNGQFPLRAEAVADKIHAPSSMALSGILSGLAKQVRAIGLEPIDMYRVHITWTEGERRRFLTLDEGFRLMAEQNNWPPASIHKQLKQTKK